MTKRVADGRSPVAGGEMEFKTVDQANDLRDHF